MQIAAAYWTDRGLNAYADQGDFREVTRRINGGYNGLADRERYYGLASMFLASQSTQAGRVLLIDGGGKEVLWNGQATKYGGVDLNKELVEQLRLVYPAPGGPWTYEGLKVWRRQNGDLVLERMK
ncbi:hypothetical protein [Deinococcus hopiensis]|uniref:hypothetical protein n=1 Tax=Deinococcus hopiensis TaxID=309885 RepID=UPI001BAF2C51|nr:hypothetical protein [Deinococcus hopiensis]